MAQELPKGFVLEEQPTVTSYGAELPEGFVLEEQTALPPEPEMMVSQREPEMMVSHEQFVEPPLEQKLRQQVPIGLEQAKISPTVQEVGRMVMSGAVAEPISGIAGIAKTVTSGPEAGVETIKQIQKAVTLYPEETSTKEFLEKAEKAIEPYIKPVVEGYKKYLADPTAEVAGPAAGAAVMTFPAFLAEMSALKLPRQIAKNNIAKVLNKTDISHAYDETGKLIPEVKQSALNSGLSKEDVQDILPDNLPPNYVRDVGRKIGDIGTSSYEKQKLELSELVKGTKVSDEVIKAAEDLGLEDVIPSEHLIDNPELLSINKSLKGISESQISLREKNYISDLDSKADDLITEFSGTTDRASISTDFDIRSEKLINDISEKESSLYKKVNKSIPRNSKVKATNTVNTIKQKVKELGSKKDLNAKEKRLLDRLSERKVIKDTGLLDQYGKPLLEVKEKFPTYSRLEQYRQWVGEAMKKNTGPFQDMGEGNLKYLYKQLAKDQEAAASAIGPEVADLYNAAHTMTIKRKGIENQLKNIQGNRLDRSVTSKAKPAVQALQTGDVKKFNEFMDNIPEGLGSDIRKSIVANSIGDIVTTKNGGLDINKFNSFWNKVNRSTSSKNALKKELGSDNFNRLNSLHTLTSRVSRGKDIPKADLESIGTIGGRLYESAVRIGVYGAISGVVKRAPIVISNILNSLIFNTKSTRIRAADQLLSSDVFRNMLLDKKSGRLNNTKAINEITDKVEKLSAYKRWKNTLSDKELSDLSSIGVVGYLTGEELKTNE